MQHMQCNTLPSRQHMPSCTHSTANTQFGGGLRSSTRVTELSAIRSVHQLLPGGLPNRSRKGRLAASSWRSKPGPLLLSSQRQLLVHPSEQTGSAFNTSSGVIQADPPNRAPRLAGSPTLHTARMRREVQSQIHGFTGAAFAPSSMGLGTSPTR